MFIEEQLMLSKSLLCARHLTLAFVAVGLAVVLTSLLTGLEESPLTLFFAAVMVSAWYGGIGPELLATGLSVMALDYFFVPPVYALGVGLVDGIRLALFALVSVLISLLNDTRKRLAEALREQNRQKEQFLIVLAHELRTPLATILYTAEHLRRRATDPDCVEKSSAIIQRQLGTLSRLISDLLDASRLRLGKLRLCKEKVDLTRVVAHAIETARPLIDASEHRLEVKVPPEPVWLEGDPLRLEQVVGNLLINAAKYTAPPGRILLTVERVGRKARLGVQDTGIGLAPEVLPKVFDLFTQAENGSKGGLGIGLSLVRDLVALHGGTVAVRSPGPGKGSEFIMELPLPSELCLFTAVA
jgi:two-component system CheB/CheR fusion protein